MNATVELVVTAGAFTLDGQSFDVENNVWLGDDPIVIVDAAHDADAIIATVGDRVVAGVVCTHGHNDHVNAAVELAEATCARVYLHPADRMLWDAVHPGRPPDRGLADGYRIGPLQVLHTPGTLAGQRLPVRRGAGRALLRRHPVRRWPRGHRSLVLGLPDDPALDRRPAAAAPPRTRVLTGHGEPTTIGAEAPHLSEWRARGH